jgi:hypothetical protein
MITAGRLPSSFTRPRRIDDDNDIFDERGIIRDGKRMRVPITMMDSRLPIERMRSNQPLVISSAGYIPEEIRARMYDGIPGVTVSSDARRSRKQVARDPMGREAGTYEEEDTYRDHKPGYRVGDAARITADAGQALKDAAYSEMVADLQDAWKPDHLRAADARRTTADAVRPLGISNSDWARELNRREISDAWKTPAPALDAAPSGKWPLSAGVGSACDLNGERGVLVEDGSGVLVCQVNRHVGPTRSDAAPPRFMDAATAQKIKDAAYNEMVSDLTNAWRT